MSLDERLLCAFSQRFCGDGQYRGLNRITEAPGADQSVAKNLESMQDTLPQPLPFHQYPVVVPARQEVKSIGTCAQD